MVCWTDKATRTFSSFRDFSVSFKAHKHSTCTVLFPFETKCQSLGMVSDSFFLKAENRALHNMLRSVFLCNNCWGGGREERLKLKFVWDLSLSPPEIISSNAKEYVICTWKNRWEVHMVIAKYAGQEGREGPDNTANFWREKNSNKTKN